MTKTLTEQWREGKLPEDTYYVRFICGRYGVYEFEQYKGFGFDNDLAYIKEVLASVPSYEEFVQQRDFVKDHQKVLIENMNLKRKLEIATKALKRIYQPAVGDIYNFETDELDHTKLQDIAHKALKEIEGVK